MLYNKSAQEEFFENMEEWQRKLNKWFNEYNEFIYKWAQFINKYVHEQNKRWNNDMRNYKKWQTDFAVKINNIKKDEFQYLEKLKNFCFDEIKMIEKYDFETGYKLANDLYLKLCDHVKIKTQTRCEYSKKLTKWAEESRERRNQRDLACFNAFVRFQQSNQFTINAPKGKNVEKLNNDPFHYKNFFQIQDNENQKCWKSSGDPFHYENIFEIQDNENQKCWE